MDDLMALADAVQTPARQDPTAAAVGPPATPPVVVADSEGRAGVRPDSGAVPFTLPQARPVPSFGAGPQCRNAERSVPCTCRMCTSTT